MIEDMNPQMGLHEFQEVRKRTIIQDSFDISDEIFFLVNIVFEEEKNE